MELISLKEAAHILGYQQSTPILALIKNKYLKTKKKKESSRRWLNKAEVLALPTLISNPQSNSYQEGRDQWTI